METTAQFMRRLDSEYRAQTGLTERRHYSIFYSQVEPSPVLVLGFNPAGAPEMWDESVLASPSFYEGREHEYVDCNYPIAIVMRRYLIEVFSLADEECIRSIPKTNLIFRRSSSQDGLALRERDGIIEAMPFLEQILMRVRPKVIICEGMSTLRHFEGHYCEVEDTEVDSVCVTTPNGRKSARIYRADRARLICTGVPSLVVGIGHPSRFGRRAEWSNVIANSKALLREVRVAT